MNCSNDFLMEFVYGKRFRSICITKSTAPRSVKVGMKYMGDPIWVSSSMYLSDGLPSLNSDLWLFEFPSTMAHMFNCYKSAWQAAHESQYLSLSSMDGLEEVGENTKKAIESSLNILGAECEKAT